MTDIWQLVLIVVLGPLFVLAARQARHPGVRRGNFTWMSYGFVFKGSTLIGAMAEIFFLGKCIISPIPPNLLILASWTPLTAFGFLLYFVSGIGYNETTIVAKNYRGKTTSLKWMEIAEWSYSYRNREWILRSTEGTTIRVYCFLTGAHEFRNAAAAKGVHLVIPPNIDGW